MRLGWFPKDDCRVARACAWGRGPVHGRAWADACGGGREAQCLAPGAGPRKKAGAMSLLSVYIIQNIFRLFAIPMADLWLLWYLVFGSSLRAYFVSSVNSVVENVIVR